MSQLLSNYSVHRRLNSSSSLLNQSFSAQKRNQLNTSSSKANLEKTYVQGQSQDISCTMNSIRKGIRSNVIEKMSGFNRFFKDNTNSQVNQKYSSPPKKSYQQQLNTSSSTNIIPSFNNLQKSLGDIGTSKNQKLSSLYAKQDTQLQGTSYPSNTSPSPKKSSAQRGIDRLGGNNNYFRDLNQSYNSSPRRFGKFSLNQNQIKADIETLSSYSRSKRRQSPLRNHSSGKSLNLNWGTPSKSLFESKFAHKYNQSIKENESVQFKKNLIDEYFESPSRKRPATSSVQTSSYQSRDFFNITPATTRTKLSDKLPVQQVIDTRYILQGATSDEVRQLPPSYVEELTKLSVAIIGSLKRTNLYDNQKFY